MPLEIMGYMAIKYDFLLLSTLDIQATTFKQLQKDGVIDPSLTLKECFRKYIDPNKIDTTDPVIWDALYNNDVLSIFQFDAASGRKGVLATKPENFQEMTALNGSKLALTHFSANQQGRLVSANGEA